MAARAPAGSASSASVRGSSGRPLGVARILLSSAFLALLALLSSCASCEPQGPTRCTTDADCRIDENDLYNICLTDLGVCGCSDDRGCGEQEFCNSLGRCQARVGCVSNADCFQDPEGSFCGSQYCDTTTGQCESNCICDPDPGQVCCSLDSHCPFGSICNALDHVCVPGCRTDGDCRLGEGCVGAGLGGQLGQCAAGVCTANNLCRFGEICNLETGECVFDSRGPYCASCTGGVASDDCGAPGNYCLTDTSDPTGQSSFCGVNCRLGGSVQPCPFGYECRDVVIYGFGNLPACTAEACVKEPGAATGRCSSNTNVTCSTDDDCPAGLPGGTCPKAKVGNCLPPNQDTECLADNDCCPEGESCPAGSCVKQRCRGGEGAAFGVCTCTKDSDCGTDRCTGADLSDPANPRVGVCELSGAACYEDLDCETIACVNGGCRIGANCAPANDRHCRELVITSGP